MGIRFKLVKTDSKPHYVPPWTGIAKNPLKPTKKELKEYEVKFKLPLDNPN